MHMFNMQYHIKLLYKYKVEKKNNQLHKMIIFLHN